MLKFNLFVSREEYGRYYETLTSLAMSIGISNDSKLLNQIESDEEELLRGIEFNEISGENQKGANSIWPIIVQLI